MRTSVLLTFLTLGAVASITEPTVSTQSTGASYSVADLGTLGGATRAHGISRGSWIIAGTSARPDGQPRAFVRAFMQPPRDLGTLGGAASDARGVSRDSYYVVGRAQTSSGRYQAFIWEPWPNEGAMTGLGTLGGSESVAHGVNDFGVVVGASKTAGDVTTRAFVYENGSMAPLVATLGGNTSVAFAINNAGRIVGQASLSGETVSHAFVFADGVTTDLGAPGGNSAALAINEIDQVVGYWESPDGASSRAFLYAAGFLQTLPALGGAFSSANALDDTGVIVGESDTSSGARRAVIWVNGQISDLNTLIPAGSGWVLQAATGIEEFGSIVGYGTYNGQPRAFLLRPPADMALSLSAHENHVDTNIPNPHEAGRTIDLGVTVQNLSNTFVTGIVITDTIGGPLEYVSWDTDAADCTQSGQTLTCHLKRHLEPGGMGRDLMIRARSTGSGTITHSATARSDGLDPDLSNNSASESNRAISLAEFTLTPTTLVGGDVSLGRTTLTSPTGPGGSRVRLVSSNPSVASVPSEFDVLPWSGDGIWREFYVRTTAVSAPTTVQISASYGLVTLTRSLTILPGASTPFDGSAHALPGTVQAEDFDVGANGVAYFDTTAGNTGGRYRATDVDIEATTDSGGGHNVGWTRAGEWLRYTVTVASAGAYTLSARVASAGTGGTFHVEFGGINKTGTVTVPNTGGWQTWTTVTTTVTLAAGTQVMRVVFDGVGSTGAVCNLNWVRVGAATQAFGGSPRALPGVVQAEDFDVGANGTAYFDTTAGNTGGRYRSTDVDIEATSDSGGGYNVGWTRAGEWLNYTVNVASAGTYILNARVASAGTGGTFHVEFGGTNKTGTITVPNTGGWQTWTTVTTTVTLAAGTQVMRVVFDRVGSTGAVCNLNWVRVDAATQAFGGSPRALPGVVQAEDFDVGANGVAYLDTTPGNAGSQYRSTDVDIQLTSDSGAGYNVGWMAAGEWLKYTVHVNTAGTYTFRARVAANGPGGTFHVEFDGIDRTGPMVVPNTGGWQAWTTVSRTVTVPAGTQVMRVVVDAHGATGIFGNLNWVSVMAP